MTQNVNRRDEVGTTCVSGWVITPKVLAWDSALNAPGLRERIKNELDNAGIVMPHETVELVKHEK